MINRLLQFYTFRDRIQLAFERGEEICFPKLRNMPYVS